MDKELDEAIDKIFKDFDRDNSDSFILISFNKCLGNWE